MPGTEGPPQDRMPSPDREVLPPQALEKRTAPSSKPSTKEGWCRKMPGGQRGAAALMKRLGDWVLATLVIAIVPGSLVALIVALFLMTFFAGR